MKIGLLGSTGYFGSNLIKNSSLEDDIYPIPRARFDLYDNLDYRVLDEYDCIINCAALIDQDRAHTDGEYRKKMYQVNAFAPKMIRDNYDGFFIHISSYFIIDGNCNDYSRTKFISHESLKGCPYTAIATPSHPYGGVGSNNYWGFLGKNLNTELVLDNVNKFNIINIENFVKAIDEIIKDGSQGQIAVYEDGEYTKYSMACKLFGERDNWKEGVFLEDVAPRPTDVVFSKMESRLSPVKYGCSPYTLEYWKWIIA